MRKWTWATQVVWWKLEIGALINFNARTSKMGIVCEVMNPQILEDKESKIQLDELIDSALMSITEGGGQELSQKCQK